MGSIIRASDAFGVFAIYLCGMTAGPEDKKVKKTALGGEKEIQFKKFRTTLDAVDEAKSQGFVVIGLEIIRGAKNISTLELNSKKIALVVGNEVSGVAPEVLARCDKVVKIPMQGQKESLNVSVAYGIAAFLLSKT